MRAKLTLDTPFGVEATVEITLFEQQCPHAVRNFLFCLNGHLIPDDARAQQEQTIGGPTPAPLLLSKLLRYMENESIEFGTSATRSMYGGFFADELFPATTVETSSPESKPKKGLSSATQSSTMTLSETCKAGALLSMNIGPHTNASKYMLLLKDDPSLQGNHVQLGQAIDLAPLMALLKTVKTHPRTNALNPGVTIAQVAVTREPVRGERASITSTRGAAKRRGREDDDEERDEEGNSIDSAASGAAGVSSSSGGRDRKRRRGETMVVDEATGEQKMISTAIPTEAGKTFDLFEAQSMAFANNLESIREVQQQRMHNRNRKDSKAKHFKVKARQARGKRY